MVWQVRDKAKYMEWGGGCVECEALTERKGRKGGREGEEREDKR